MAKLTWGAYTPDILDLNAPISRLMKNVIPRGDGYGPMRDIAAFTASLPSACRGYFLARRPDDNSVMIFAGTATKLYLLDNTVFTWTDISRGAGTYTSVSPDAQWTFAQFGTRIIAAQKNDKEQSYVIGSSSAFADLAGNPPQAGWVAVVGDFVVLGDLLSNPNRLQWCGFGDPTNWTAGVSQSDFQDMADLGGVRAVEEISQGVGLIAQDSGFRRMVYAPGSPLIFQIEKVRTDIGILAPHSLAIANGQAFFLSSKGFVQLGVDGSVNFIGEEKVDRTILGQHEATAPPDVLGLAYDNSQPQLVCGAADPKRNLYMCAYKSLTGAPNLFDRALIYHWALQRWSPVNLVGEYIEHIALPGITIEGLDLVAPGAVMITGAANNGSGKVRLTCNTSTIVNGSIRTISGVGGTTEANGTWTVTVVDGTHLDLLAVSFVHAYTSGGVVAGSIDGMVIPWDSISTTSLPALSAANASHAIGFFGGTPLEATLSTPEQQLDENRVDINGIAPICDAAVIYASIFKRENLNTVPAQSAESLMDGNGNCNLLEEGNLVRAQIRIPAGTLWNYAAGLDMDVTPSGALSEF